MIIESELIIDLINSFDNILNVLDKLKYSMCEKDKDLPIWFDKPNNFQIPYQCNLRMQAFLFINQLEYFDNQDPKEILIGPGLVASSSETIDIVSELNLAKDNFKKNILNLKANKIAATGNDIGNIFKNALNTRDEQVKSTLKKIGLRRLHLKQCYRKLPLFVTRPNKVSWTWAHTRAIKKIDIKTAILMLQKQGNDPGILAQIQKVSSLSSNEKLAIVQELAPHLRANLVFPDVGDEVTRKMVKGPIPIFYLDKFNELLPSIKPPKNKTLKDENRVIRSDVKIDPIEYLPAIHAHRYL